MEAIIKKLRNKESISLLKDYDGRGKHFFKIQLNKDVIAWERYVSKDRRNWIKLNSCLTLREVVNFVKTVIFINFEQ